MYVGNLIFNNNTVQLKPPLIFIEYVFLCSTKQLGHQRHVTLDSLLTNEGLNLFGDCMDKQRLSIRSNKVTVLHQKSFITGQIFHGISIFFSQCKKSWHLSSSNPLTVSIIGSGVGGLLQVYELKQ